MTIGSFSILLETRDVDPFHAVILVEFESIHIRLARYLDHCIVFLKERMLRCSKRQDRHSQCFCWCSFLTPIRQHHIWRQFQQQQIVESFVESNMVAVLDSVGEQITPHDVLQRVGSVPKEDSLLGVLDALRSILPS